MQVWVGFSKGGLTMSEKRRDKKNRILRTGESQRKDGRYRYKYKDINGQERNVYSWRLDASDPTPKGKKRELSLREKEQEIIQDQSNGISPNGGGYTVLSLTEKYISTKTNIRQTTKQDYQMVINILKKETIAKKPINEVKTGHIKDWVIKMHIQDGRKYGQIHKIMNVLRPAFQLAENDDLIKKNPCRFKLSTIVKNDTQARNSITPTQESMFLDFVKNDSVYHKYYDEVYVLFKTGLRISEFCGLTIQDINFDGGYINIDKQLIRASTMKYLIQEPKSKSGIRYVPMFDDVYDCLRSIISKRRTPKKEFAVDGVSGFLNLDKNKMPTISLHWDGIFKRIWTKFVKTKCADFPLVTPHVCRHTFCSNMIRKGMNPKILQYIMGHSTINMTLNTYTHINYEDVCKAVESLPQSNIDFDIQ